MDWSGGRYERILAGAYLAGWAVWLIGVIWTLINQATGGTGLQVVIAGVLFFGGLLAITAVAYFLRNRVPTQAVRFTAKASSYQRAWHRLALGIELSRAWRALTG
jgi:hypothetical protein